MFLMNFILNMDVYDNRLASFKGWSGREDVKILAAVGFYFTGESDRIVCYYCKLDLYNFEGCVSTDSLSDHKRYSPKCPFYSINKTNYVNTSFLSPRTIMSNYPHLAPHKGDYTLLEHRINSFVNFPKCLKGLVSSLCEAGFYYTNVGDYVCCYVCSVMVNNWNVDSDPWRVHKSLNSRCSLLKLVSSDNNNNFKGGEVTTPTAPLDSKLDHYSLPKCLKCKTNYIDAVMWPCCHFCVCQQCALTSVECVTCNVFAGGFFAVKIPTDFLNVVDNDRI